MAIPFLIPLIINNIIDCQYFKVSFKFKWNSNLVHFVYLIFAVFSIFCPVCDTNLITCDTIKICNELNMIDTIKSISLQS